MEYDNVKLLKNWLIQKRETKHYYIKYFCRVKIKFTISTIILQVVIK